MRFTTSLMAAFAATAHAAPFVEKEVERRADGPGSVRSRDGSGIRTEIDLGTDYIDYGCGASIRHTLLLAIDDLCRSSASSCDEGREFSRDVDWTEGARIEPFPITVKAEGSYPNAETLSIMKETIREAVNDATAVHEDVDWTGIDYQWQSSGVCDMSRFSNHIKVT